MKGSLKKNIFAILVLITFNTSTFAFLTVPTPTIIGSTGLVRMPSADVLPYKNINIGLEMGGNLLSDKSSFFYKMNLGTFQGLEIGFVGMDNTQGMAREGVLINMKYSLLTDASPYPLLFAIGAENLASFNNTDVYMVCTKYFQGGPKFHFGFMGDFPGDNKFRPLGMLGFEMPLLFENLYWQLDAIGGEVVFEANTGIRWYVNESFTWHLNFVNFNSDVNTPVENYKDPKAILIGFSWINPL